mgnify:FL=1
MDMADRIKQQRIKMGYTQEELGQKLGLQKSAIAKYENGRVENMKRSVIVNMAKVLECSPAYLMGWEAEAPEEKPALTARDERDIKKDLDSIMEKLSTGEAGPASYDGESLDPEAAELFKDELEIALRRLKLINKEKYTPKKYKK